MAVIAFTPLQYTASHALSNGSGSLAPFNRLQTLRWAESRSYRVGKSTISRLK